MTNKTKPVHEIRIGLIKAAVWENQSASKGIRHTVTFSRIYRDGNEWKRSESFGRDDLLTLAKVADLAHTWTFQQGQTNEEEAAA